MTRLEGLLTGLLEYHRVGKDEMAVEEIDTGALVDAITADLELPQGFQVRRAETMPRITGPRTPLETVLRNLIANAAKHHDRDRGLVTVTGAVDGAWVRFRVTDDGPGIDPQYREHVFKLFTTLKPRDTVEGSGMGLAIVKRIVKRFGGAIRLTAPEDGARGTVAAFTWPAQAG